MGFGQVGIIFVSLLGLAGLGWNSYCDYSAIKDVSLAKETLSKGFPRIANELSQNMRSRIKYNQEECDLLLAIDSKLRKSSGLFLNAEKCLYSGHVNSPNPYLAISLAFEIEGDLKSAKSVLFKTIEQLKFNELFFFRLAYLSYIENNKDEAKNILQGLISRNLDDENIILNSIQFFTKKNEWQSAYSLMPFLEKVKDISFESKITLYGVAKKNDDTQKSKKYLNLLNEDLSKLPKEKSDRIRLQLQSI